MVEWIIIEVESQKFDCPSSSEQRSCSFHSPSTLSEWSIQLLKTSFYRLNGNFDAWIRNILATTTYYYLNRGRMWIVNCLNHKNNMIETSWIKSNYRYGFVHVTNIPYQLFKDISRASAHYIIIFTDRQHAYYWLQLHN